MTLFNKLAGKASALLNASGICSNNCIDGHCSGCGECCADLLPLTKGEIKRLRDYARKHHLQENKRSFLETKGGPDTIITKDGQMVRGRVLANASDGGNFLGHIPHWANCPGAAGLRKMRNPR